MCTDGEVHLRGGALAWRRIDMECIDGEAHSQRDALKLMRIDVEAH